MNSTNAYIAIRRFGLGASARGADEVGRDPLGWLDAQIAPDLPLPRALHGFSSSEAIGIAMRKARREAREAGRRPTMRGQRQAFSKEVAARATAIVQSKTPFAERMVLFWSNHFTVSRSKSSIAPTIPAYEREAIRPNVFGSFADLLLAVTGHTTMLAYLDNVVSVGPTSRAGRRTGRSLNENLAREILELHTLGVDGGYSQQDVEELAKALTGWTHAGVGGRRNQNSAGFAFRPQMHEPGARKVLGRTYRPGGIRQARDILRDLAVHLSTARFISGKIAQHFIADEPPPRAVDRLTETWLDTGGDLAAVCRSLIRLDDAWHAAPQKFTTPYEMVIATHKALGIREITQRNFALPLRLMGQMPFSAVSPKGCPDAEADWLAPEAVMRRIEWLRAAASHHAPDTRPTAFAERLLGPYLTDETRRMLVRAPSGDAAVALALLTPEFQRR